jgi:peptidyl-prolyl cis-trans isomerase D
MITVFRKNQRVLMLVVAVLTIVAFVWLYNPANPEELGANNVARIYGRTVTQPQIEREFKNFQLALAMGQMDLVSDLGGISPMGEEDAVPFIFNLFVIQHEAANLGIAPTVDQIAAGIMALPVFQTSGQFDRTKYATFLSEQLGPRGFTERQLESVLRDALVVERLKEIVGAPITVGPGELRDACRVFEQVDLAVLNFDVAGVEVPVPTEEDVEGYFTRNQATLVRPETRRIDYVSFALTPEESALTGKERTEARQKLANAAVAFVEKATEGNFATLAAENKLTLRSSPAFDKSGTVASASQVGGTSVDQVMAEIRPLARTAFLLGPEAPISDVVESGDVFYVVRLVETTPEAPLTLEEARPQILERLAEINRDQAVREAGEAKVAAIRTDLAAGKSITDAAAATQVTVTTRNGVDPSSQTGDPENRRFALVAMNLQPGQVSNFDPTPSGGFAVFLASRTALADEEFARRSAEVRDQIARGKRDVLFATWLGAARDAANITMNQR